MKSFRLLTIVTLLFAPAVVLASTDAGGHEGGWMEKWLSFDPGLFIWTVITFLIVLAILRWKAWGPLMTALNHREQAIEESLAKAAEARQEADQVSRKFDEMIQKAHAESQKIISNGKAAGERLKEEMELAARQKSEEILEKARMQIEAEREKAIKEIQTSVVELSISAASKVLEKNLDTDENRKLVQKTLSEVGQA